MLASNAHGLISFHISDADVSMGTAVAFDEWWGEPVELTFRYLDPDEETALMADAGLAVVGRLDRAPYAGVEHASRRGYLTVARQ